MVVEAVIVQRQSGGQDIGDDKGKPAPAFAYQVCQHQQQVAEKVGFASANYFARVFRQQMGMTPRQYRECKQKGRRAGKEGAEISGYSSK